MQWLFHFKILLHRFFTYFISSHIPSQWLSPVQWGRGEANGGGKHLEVAVLILHASGLETLVTQFWIGTTQQLSNIPSDWAALFRISTAHPQIRRGLVKVSKPCLSWPNWPVHNDWQVHVQQLNSIKEKDDFQSMECLCSHNLSQAGH